MAKQLFILAHDVARQRAVEAVRNAPAGFRVVVEAPKKTRDQEAKYHAMFGDIARQVPMHGVDLPPDDMKRALFSAFKIDTKDDPEMREAWAAFGDVRMGVGFRGEIVVFGDQTRKLPKVLASALIEWLYAFGSDYDVQWTEPQERRAA